MGDANTTLTASNGVADQSRNFVIEATGAHTASRDLIIPAAEKVYLVKNSTTGGFPIVVKVSGQTGATIPYAESRLVFCDATVTYSAGSFLTPSADSAFTAAQSITLASTVAVPLEIISTFDDASIGPILSLYRSNAAGEASADIIGGLYFYGTDSANNKELFSAIKVTMDDVTSASEDGSLAIGVVTAGTFAYELNLTGTVLSPVASGGLALGSGTLMWSNLFLAASAGINFNNGDVAINHTTNTLSFAGASSGYKFDAMVGPSTDDGAALGSTSLEWSDIFLATGAVLNWAASDVTITHAANTLTFAGASSGYKFDALVAPSADDGSPLGSTGLRWSDLFFATGAVINFGTGDVTITHSTNNLSFEGAASGYNFDQPVIAQTFQIEPGASRSSVSAHNGGNTQTISTVSETQVTFGTEIWDTGSDFASSAWTPPAGTILISASVYFVGVSTGPVYLMVKKDNSEFKRVQSDVAGGVVSICIIDQTAGTEVYTIWVAAPNDANASYTLQGGTSYSWFMGSMI
jgi:hypothetical protein